MTPYEMLTVASIVEKEGYIPVNMPDMARVIYNRLARGIPLQMDSTVLYALGQDGGPVTSQDLKIQSPYNSYLNTGLTPTPICMPSMDALDAAVHPPTGALALLRAGAEGRHHGLLRHLRRAVGQRATGEEPWPPLTSGASPAVTMDGARPGWSRRPAGRRHRQPHRPLTLTCAAQRGVRRARAGATWRSLAFEVPPGQAESALGAMRRARISGLSVTMPHKADVLALVDECSDVARRLGAVNCVVNRDGVLLGTNTDGAGFVASLARGAAFTAAGKRCLVVGAGGAARAVVLALAHAGAEQIAVLNRTRERARRPPRWPARRVRWCRRTKKPRSRSCSRPTSS